MLLERRVTVTWGQEHPLCFLHRTHPTMGTQKQLRRCSWKSPGPLDVICLSHFVLWDELDSKALPLSDLQPTSLDSSLFAQHPVPVHSD